MVTGSKDASRSAERPSSSILCAISDAREQADAFRDNQKSRKAAGAYTPVFQLTDDDHDLWVGCLLLHVPDNND